MPSPSHLFPGYVAGTLSVTERQEVDTWLATHPTAVAELAAWRAVRSAVTTQTPPLLSSTARQRIWQNLQSQIHPTPQPWAPRPQTLSWAIALSLTIMALLWGVLQPGLGLQWAVAEGTGATAYRIYRAPLAGPGPAGAASAAFTLLAEIPANPAQHEYVYVDTHLWPWETYQYRVESVGDALVLGVTPSATIVAAPTALWVNFIAMLMLSLAAGWGGVWLMQQPAPKRLVWR